MEKIVIGKTEIPFTFSQNKRLKRKRLTITPNGVLLEANGTDQDDIDSFLEQKEEWIINKWDDLSHKEVLNPWPTTFASGHKILFRDRYEMLTIMTTSESEVSIEHSMSGFLVFVPRSIPVKERDSVIKDYFVSYFEQYIINDALDICNKYYKKLGKLPKMVKVTNRKDVWGLCNKDGSISIGMSSVFLPRPVFEYVVLHELCHLKERNHGEKFWGLVGSVMPDYMGRKDYLEKSVQFIFDR